MGEKCRLCGSADNDLFGGVCEGFHAEDCLTRRLTAAESERDRLQKLNAALERLLVCYRLQKNPPGKLLDEIRELKEAAHPAGDAEGGEDGHA